MASGAREWDFPLLEDPEIVKELKEILPPQSADQFSINDIKKPSAVKWQKLYIDILCTVFDLQVSERGTRATALWFNTA